MALAFLITAQNRCARGRKLRAVKTAAMWSSTHFQPDDAGPPPRRARLKTTAAIIARQHLRADLKTVDVGGNIENEQNRLRVRTSQHELPALKPAHGVAFGFVRRRSRYVCDGGFVLDRQMVVSVGMAIKIG